MNPLEWKGNFLPVSTRFDDPYYSSADGRAETSHVFIGGNALPARWPVMQECTIAELGFGTGLNFLETVYQWRKFKPANAQLNYISFEQYPVEPQDMQKALSAWPELDEQGQRLYQIWDPAVEVIDTGFAGDIHLAIFMGDANVRLPQTRFEADAWYLDGFSPAKNPELWNAELMQEVATHTKTSGTFATYSSAGFVRRSLEACGFDVRKTNGFGTKRHMLCGIRRGDIDVADGH